MISIILVEPENPGNLGAVARVMKNFDVENLIVINPKCDVKDVEALKRSKQGLSVLENVTQMTLNELKFDYLIGTSAKIGSDYNIMRSPVLSSEFADKLGQESNIGIMIGRESSGLTNKELDLCDFIVHIPSSIKYPTLNISHSVTILLYELYKRKNKIKPITREKKELIMNLFENLFSLLDFQTDAKKDIQFKLWKKIIGKSLLSERESFLIMGLLRKIIDKL